MSPQKTGDGSTPPDGSTRTESRDEPASAEHDTDAGRASPDQVESETPGGSARGQNSGNTGREPRAASARPANYKWVGSQVRRMYDSVLTEPVPKNFTDLLRQAYDGKKTPEKS
jgi:hypothetical protein